MLEPVGLTPDEEVVYRTLLIGPRSSVTDLASEAQLPRNRCRRSLETLLQKGLASRLPGKAGAFVAVPPNIALHALVDRRRQELDELTRAISDLQSEFAAAAGPKGGPELVEVVRGKEAFIQRYLQLRRAASVEWLALDKPPYITPQEDCVDSFVDQVERNVRTRVIYAQEVLTRPGRFDDIQQAVAIGREARVLPDVPLKIAVADNRFGLIPLEVAAGEEAAVLVHASPLLEALVGFFELLWSRAMPLHAPSESTANGDRGTDEGQLLSLVASGLTDETIAVQLGVATRTVRRRISRLMDDVGANSRFQLGYQAAKRGLI